MDFRTEIRLKQGPLSLGYSDTVLCLGSCFADRIGHRLQEHRFKTLVNPFGVIFHPTPLMRTAAMCLNGSEDEIIEGLFQEQEQWRSFNLHSRFNHRDRNIMEKVIREQFAATRVFMQDSNVWILTLGTAWAWEHPRHGIVANNQRQPLKTFQKRLSTPEEIAASVSEVLDQIVNLHPELKIILTVSPVRHTKQGLSDNMLSKSTLRLACASLEKQYSNLSYFPSYEIMLDDLRDYRYYRDDLIHPTDFAERYIFDHFKEYYFNAETQKLMLQWQKLKAGLEHRPFNRSSKAYQQHLKHLQLQFDALRPFMDIEDCASRLQELSA